MQGLKLVCWDFEGCGLYPLQVGISTMENGEIKTGFFSDLYAPRELKIPWQSPASSLDRDILARSPRLHELWPHLAPYWNCHSFVSHNKGTERKYLGAFPLHAAPGWLDTLKISRFAYPSLPDHSLSALLKSVNLYDEALRLASSAGQVSEHHPIFDTVGSLLLLKHLWSHDNWKHATLEQMQQIRPKAYYTERRAKASPINKKLKWT